MGPPGPPGKAVPCGDCPYGTWVPGHYEPVLPEGVEAKEGAPAAGDAVVAAEPAQEPAQEPQVGAEAEVSPVEVSAPAVPPPQEIASEAEAQGAAPAVPSPEPEIAETVQEPLEKTKKKR